MCAARRTVQDHHCASPAGLLPLTGGHIRLAGATLDDPARRRWTRPEQRSVGVVFQDYRLFPHLSALENVAFGLRCRGATRRRARELARPWLARVGLAEYAGRKPRQLSGGQAQRIALARALAVNPALLLLDEPLAALDARTRLDTRAELHRHLSAHPGATLLVTHDPLDALVLADRLVIIEDGQVVQAGDAATITAQPRTDYVARLVGLNLYRGWADGHSVTLRSAAATGDHAARPFQLTTADQLHGEFVAFRPAVALYRPPEPAQRQASTVRACSAAATTCGSARRRSPPPPTSPRRRGTACCRKPGMGSDQNLKPGFIRGHLTPCDGCVPGCGLPGDPPPVRDGQPYRH